MVRDLCDEIAYEAAVLFERHAEVMVTAGLPLSDFEDGAEPAVPPNVDENTKSIMRQFKLLEVQLAFLEGIEKQVVAFRASLDN